MEISRIQGPITPVKPVTLDEIRRRSEKEKLKEATVDTSAAIRNQISTISDVVDEAPVIELEGVAMDMDLEMALPTDSVVSTNLLQQTSIGLNSEDIQQDLLKNNLSAENDLSIAVEDENKNVDVGKIEIPKMPENLKILKYLELDALEKAFEVAKKKLEPQVRNLKAKLETAKQEQEIREKEVENAQKKKMTVEKNIERKERELENEENELKDLKEEQKTVQENIDKLNSDLEKAQRQQQAQVQKEFQAMMQKAMADYNPQVHGQDYQAYLAEKQSNFSATPNPKVSSLSASVKAANSDLAAIGSNMQAKMKNISDISVELEDLGNKLDMCNNNLNAAQSNLNIAKDNTVAAETKYKSTFLKLDEVNANINMIKKSKEERAVKLK